MDVASSGLKRKRTIQIAFSAKFKSQHLWWYGGVSVPMAWVTCTSVKAPFMLKGTYRFWSKICCHPCDVFFRDIPASFSKIKSYIKQEWERIPPTKLQQLVSSVPKCLSVVKMKGDVTQWWKYPCPNSFGMCCRHQIQNEWIFARDNKVDQFEHCISCLCGVFNWIWVNQDLQVIVYCFYLRFTQRSNFIVIGVCI